MLLLLSSIILRLSRPGIHRCFRRLLRQLSRSSDLIGVLILARRAVGIVGLLSTLPMRSSKSLSNCSIAIRVRCISACAMSSNLLGILRLLRIRASSPWYYDCSLKPSMAFPAKSVTDGAPDVCLTIRCILHFVQHFNKVSRYNFVETDHVPNIVSIGTSLGQK